MHSFSSYLALLGLLGTLAAGCASTSQETAHLALPRGTLRSDERESPASAAELYTPRGAGQEREAISWKPKFMPTGMASGVMIEFTGMKKDKQVNARYAGIVLQAAGSSSGRTYTSTINSLRQAFFEVPPGTYTLRQMKAWADPVVVRDLVVKDGQYSLVYIPVLNPRASRSKEAGIE